MINMNKNLRINVVFQSSTVSCPLVIKPVPRYGVPKYIYQEYKHSGEVISIHEPGVSLSKASELIQITGQAQETAKSAHTGGDLILHSIRSDSEPKFVEISSPTNVSNGVNVSKTEDEGEAQGESESKAKK